MALSQKEAAFLAPLDLRVLDLPRSVSQTTLCGQGILVSNSDPWSSASASNRTAAIGKVCRNIHWVYPELCYVQGRSWTGVWTARWCSDRKLGSSASFTGP